MTADVLDVLFWLLPTLVVAGLVVRDERRRRLRRRAKVSDG